jgi:hypothetical protein
MAQCTRSLPNTPQPPGLNLLITFRQQVSNVPASKLPSKRCAANRGCHAEALLPFGRRYPLLGLPATRSRATAGWWCAGSRVMRSRAGRLFHLCIGWLPTIRPTHHLLGIAPSRRMPDRLRSGQLIKSGSRSQQSRSGRERRDRAEAAAAAARSSCRR